MNLRPIIRVRLRLYRPILNTNRTISTWQVNSRFFSRNKIGQKKLRLSHDRSQCDWRPCDSVNNLFPEVSMAEERGPGIAGLHE